MSSAATDRGAEQAELAATFDRLWPILRSLTGAGVRESHDILGELLPLGRFEIASGTGVFDWTVPPEWVVREAYVVTPDGRRILDVRANTLHLVNYAVPFRGLLSRAELDAHLYSLPEQPDAIPYVTSYYTPRWGFCLTHQERERLPEGVYEVVVDTEHLDGSRGGAMTLGEAVLPGETDEEVLLSTYTCHPSLANNELSGPLVTAFLYRRLARWERRRYTYRFAFVPETVGALAYLTLRGEALKRNLAAGYVVTCAGDDAPFTYKRSRRGDTLADRAALHVLGRLPDTRVRTFFPQGSDERQYGSPGFNLPVGSIMRSMYGTYPEYHTSLDNRDFISFAALQGSVDVYEQVLRALEQNGRFRNLAPYGEPNLGKRGLYPERGTERPEERVAATLWVLNYADGLHDLLQIAEMSGLELGVLADAARACVGAGLLEPLP